MCIQKKRNDLTKTFMMTSNFTTPVIYRLKYVPVKLTDTENDQVNCDQNISTYDVFISHKYKYFSPLVAVICVSNSSFK